MGEGIKAIKPAEVTQEMVRIFDTLLMSYVNLGRPVAESTIAAGYNAVIEGQRVIADIENPNDVVYVPAGAIPAQAVANLLRDSREGGGEPFGFPRETLVDVDGIPNAIPAIAGLLRQNHGVTLSVMFSTTEGQFTISVRNRSGISVALGMDAGADDLLLTDTVRRAIGFVSDSAKRQKGGGNG